MRKKVEEYILSILRKILDDDLNINLYKDMFKNMSDEEFNTYMEELRDGKRYIEIIIPHELENKISLEKNIKIAKEMGIKFMSKLIFKNDGYLPSYESKGEYIVIDLPYRRMKQTVSKGISVSKDIKTIDTLTGQVVNDSKSAKITLPELHILNSMGLEKTMIELTKDRGGDISAMNVLIDGLMRDDSRVTRSMIDNITNDKANSTHTLKAYLNGMMIDINL